MKKTWILNNNYKIPNIIHQTFINSNLPTEMVKIILHNKNICSYCKFIFYYDNDCDTFIKKNFDEKIYNAFKKINPVYGAMKADFFRYCILYKIGGIYLDIKSIINFPLFKLIQPNDDCILDLPRNNLEPWREHSPTYEQWLLIFAPNHPYLLEMINQMVNYIEIKYQPIIKGINILNSKQKILHITGPDSFTKAINTTIQNNDNKLLHRSINYNNYFKLNGSTNYRNMYKINNKKHYSEYNEPLYK
jgi:mannosyltransferase OCH1-like enzyme